VGLSALFDRPLLHSIQWAGMVLVLLAVAGCKEEAPIQTDAGATVVTPPVIPSPEDAGIAAAADATVVEDGAIGETPDGADGAVDDEEGDQDAAVQEGEFTYYRATGKAKKSVDIQLSRDAAANRARKALYKLLKAKGIPEPGPDDPARVTIRRFWAKGKTVYAEAELALPAANTGVNHPPAPASNPATSGQQPTKGTP
jgi:hypothetical protein